MKTLHLMRHAKAVDDRGSADRDRALADRGHKDARKMGRFLQEQGVAPDLILCSAAKRTRETYEAVREFFPKTEVWFEEKLYMAEESDIADAIAAVAPGIKEILLIGHNPGIHRFAADKARKGKDRLIDELSTGFPTATVASLTFNITDWDEIGRKGGELIRLRSPEDED